MKSSQSRPGSTIKPRKSSTYKKRMEKESSESENNTSDSSCSDLKSSDSDSDEDFAYKNVQYLYI